MTSVVFIESCKVISVKKKLANLCWMWEPFINGSSLVTATFWSFAILGGDSLHTVFGDCCCPIYIGRFSEAGLLEWMRFVIFRARGCSTPLGWFLSRRCFTLCITVEAEPRIAKQYKCQYCCSCKNYCGKGMEGGKKSLCVDFWLNRRSRVRRKNAFWGIL